MGPSLRGTKEVSTSPSSMLLHSALEEEYVTTEGGREEERGLGGLAGYCYLEAKAMLGQASLEGGQCGRWNLRQSVHLVNQRTHSRGRGSRCAVHHVSSVSRSGGHSVRAFMYEGARRTWPEYRSTLWVGWRSPGRKKLAWRALAVRPALSAASSTLALLEEEADRFVFLLLAHVGQLVLMSVPQDEAKATLHEDTSIVWLCEMCIMRLVHNPSRQSHRVTGVDELCASSDFTGKSDLPACSWLTCLSITCGKFS